jgi:phosphohistidine phosphatase
MKKLLLIRHGKSSWKDAGLADIDRPLNKRGKRDASLMAKRLRTMNILPDLMLCSPAKRATNTAKKFAKILGVPRKCIVFEKHIYEGDVATLLKTVQQIDDSHNLVFLIGHNPDLTSFAWKLAYFEGENIPTCGIVSVHFECDSWKDVNLGMGKVMFFEYPRMHV